MKFWRITSSFVLFAAAFVFVAYANSRPANESGMLIYHSHNGIWELLLGSCELKVAKRGETFSFTAQGHSATEFYGPWPEEPGQLELLSVSARHDEALTITFAGLPGKVEPVGYVFRSSGLRTAAGPSALFEMSCIGLIAPQSAE